MFRNSPMRTLLAMASLAHLMAPPIPQRRRSPVEEPPASKVRGNQPTRGRVKRARTAPPVDPRQAKVNRLTNWQRNQWARAGYPKDVERFARMMKHPKSAFHSAGLAIAEGIRGATDAAVAKARRRPARSIPGAAENRDGDAIPAGAAT